MHSLLFLSIREIYNAYYRKECKGSEVQRPT